LKNKKYKNQEPKPRIDWVKIFLLLLGVFLMITLSLSAVIFASEESFESYEVNPTAWGMISETLDWAQTFTPRNDFNITKVGLELRIYDAKERLNRLYVKIVETQNNKPTGSVISEGYILCSTISNTTTAWYNITMSDRELITNRMYAIFVYVTFTGTPTSDDMVMWHYDHQEATYPRGRIGKTADSGASWTMYNDADAMFIIYGEYEPPAPPSEPDIPTTIDFDGIPVFFGSALGIGIEASKIMLSSFVMLAMMIPCFVVPRKVNVMIVAMIGVMSLGTCVALGWLDSWIFLLVCLIVAGLYGSKVSDWLGK